MFPEPSVGILRHTPTGWAQTYKPFIFVKNIPYWNRNLNFPLSAHSWLIELNSAIYENESRFQNKILIRKMKRKLIPLLN